jgi:signal transduction histidine kinase
VNRTSYPGVGDLSRTGTITLLIGAALAIIVTVLFQWLGPPSVEEVERDIWQDWARATVDSQGENIAGLLARGQQHACQELLADFGRTTTRFGDSFVLRTSVHSIRVHNQAGEPFAEWISDEATPDGDLHGWSRVLLTLSTDGARPVGSLDVLYKFNEQTLGALPNLRRLSRLHSVAVWIVMILAAAMLLAALANRQRLHERALRLKSQQVTLDLARQLCHELRNGLWAFSLEGNNLRQLFEMIDRYFTEEPTALAEAARKLNLEPKEFDRLRRQVTKFLADKQLDPQTDLLAANAMARQSQQQIESFSRYINLTVEQLDRNLLGQSLAWEPTSTRVIDCWLEACGLLELRMHSAGVTHEERIDTDDDWTYLDRRALVHVFVNLAKNAIEAMRDLPAPRVMTFQLTRLQDQVEVSLHNCGTPIDPAFLPRLFERGFSTKAGAGRGIGLALVRESVERMGGTIHVLSDASGTTFRLRLPFHARRLAETEPVPA